MQRMQILRKYYRSSQSPEERKFKYPVDERASEMKAPLIPEPLQAKAPPVINKTKIPLLPPSSFIDGKILKKHKRDIMKVESDPE